LASRTLAGSQCLCDAGHYDTNATMRCLLCH
jgi:hypothetical protein